MIKGAKFYFHIKKMHPSFFYLSMKIVFFILLLIKWFSHGILNSSEKALYKSVEESVEV